MGSGVVTLSWAVVIHRIPTPLASEKKRGHQCSPHLQTLCGLSESELVHWLELQVLLLDDGWRSLGQALLLVLWLVLVLASPEGWQFQAQVQQHQRRRATSPLHLLLALGLAAGAGVVT